MARTKRSTKPVTDNVETMPESKDQKLIRLSAKRVNKAINDVRLIGNLSAYKPNDAQIDAIMQALGESCAAAEARMRGSKRDVNKFSLAS